MIDRRRALAFCALSIPALFVACRRHAWQGHIRLDGLYRATLVPARPDGPPARNRFLRFFGDGRLFHLDASYEAEFAAKLMVPGYVETSNRGRWSIAGDEVDLSLNSDGAQNIPSRDARGKITESGADLTWAAGGSDAREHFDFVAVAVIGD